MSLLARLEAAETAHLKLYACGPGARIALFDGAGAVYAGPDLPVNVAAGLGADPAALDQIEAFYAAHALPARLVLYSEVSAALLERLAKRGYTLTRLLHVHVRELDVDTLPSSELPVCELEPERWADLAARAFGPGSEAIMRLTARRPHTRLYAAWKAGEPIAVGALSVLDGVALLFSAATLPEFQRQGAQGALLRARLQDARAAGADMACVLTAPGSASERNVRRLGFTLVGARLSFERA